MDKTPVLDTSPPEGDTLVASVEGHAMVVSPEGQTSVVSPDGFLQVASSAEHALVASPEDLGWGRSGEFAEVGRRSAARPPDGHTQTTRYVDGEERAG